MDYDATKASASNVDSSSRDTPNGHNESHGANYGHCENPTGREICHSSTASETIPTGSTITGTSISGVPVSEFYLATSVI